MKRALAIAVALCTLGIVGFAQLTGVTGEWSQTVRLATDGTGALGFYLRPGSMRLNFTVSGWTITTTTVFGFADAYLGRNFALTEQRFAISGTFGPFTVSGGMNFNAGITQTFCEYCVWDDISKTYQYGCRLFQVTPPGYMNSFLNSAFDFGGVNIGLRVDHWLYPYGCGTLFCDIAKQTPGDSTMLYTFTVGIAPVTLDVRFIDCCTGIQFGDVLIRMRNVGLCCGITYDMKLYFTKEGFQWVFFGINDFIKLCCGISFDMTLKFTTTAKEITLIPKFGGLEFCGTIYADVLDKDPVTGGFDLGLEVYGWSFSCTLSDCYKLSVLTAFSCPVDPKSCNYPASWCYLMFTGRLRIPDNLNKVPAVGDTGKFYWLNEFQYIQVDACGAACCGGKWTGYLRFYFGKPTTWGTSVVASVPTGPTCGSITYTDTTVGSFSTLFGLTRVRGQMSLPIMTNFTITNTFTWTLFANQLVWDVGWRLTF